MYILRNMEKLRYFNLWEFDSPDLAGSGERMDKDFLKKLDEARHKAGVSFSINSGYRTTEHNKKVGGKADSSHTKGLAVDIHAATSRKRYLILQALIEVGFHRIGIANNFIHVDDDKQKPKQVTWLY